MPRLCAMRCNGSSGRSSGSTSSTCSFAAIAASTFFEQRRAEWMLAQFRALGCVARIDRGGNVIAHPVENRTGPYIALTAHLDTVLAPRKDEEVYVAPDGRLHGPGTADNGAGLTALLAIARAINSFPALLDEFRNLVFIANVGEEGEGNLSGMRYLCRQSSTGGRIQAFLILDGPNIDHVTSQALASRRFDVTISGPGGHSWSDYGFANPDPCAGTRHCLFYRAAVAHQRQPAIVVQLRDHRRRIEHQLHSHACAHQSGHSLGEPGQAG